MVTGPAGDTTLTITREVAEAMLAQARAELPNEACGILAGSLSGRRADTYHAARNAEASPLRYNVASEDLMRIVFAIEAAGQDLTGIFHSHTRTPAIPSATDRRSAMYPDAFHVLATLADPGAPADRALRAWRIYRGQSFEVPLRIE